MLTLTANAKINLTIEVIAKRNDGYHEIVSILQAIDLADALTFEDAKEIGFVCHDSELARTDLLEETILKTAGLLQAETGCSKGALIAMEKARIPRAAGLGSSSTVPATVLKGLNELWSLGLTPDDLCQLASRLGSDTPFFIRGGTALARGRGELINPLPSMEPMWLILLIPEIDPLPDKTARMYGMLNVSHYSSGIATQLVQNELQRGNRLRFGMLYNTFEHVAYDFFEPLGDYRAKFLSAGARKVHLAGAGPALFALADSETEGQVIANRLNAEGMKTYLTCTV